MATLAVWRFRTSDGAAHALRVLEDPAHRDPDLGYDAAVVEWPAGARRPRTHAPTGSATTGALGDGFWALLFGLVFFVPLLGAAIGAATGALAGALTDVGIDDHFINRVRDQVIPGTSALFLLGSASTVAEVQHDLGSRPSAELIVTEIDDQQEAALRQVFGVEPGTR